MKTKKTGICVLCGKRKPTEELEDNGGACVKCAMDYDVPEDYVVEE